MNGGENNGVYYWVGTMEVHGVHDPLVQREVRDADLLVTNGKLEPTPNLNERIDQILSRHQVSRFPTVPISNHAA